MSTAVITHRVNYSEYMADVTGTQKTTKPINTGASRQNQGAHQTGATMPHYGGGAEKCARCAKNVYLAEKKVGAGRSFHSSCFSCETCNRKLDAATLSEHKGEIYCKTCYTRQFGVHGLVSGVTMSTENPVREVRHSRRSSYGSDLDAPVITHKQTRQRAHSNDNTLRGEHGPTQNDEVPKMFPWRNDVLPEHPQQYEPGTSPSKAKITAIFDEIVNRPYVRPTSQIGFEKVLQSTADEIHSGEVDRQKYHFGDGEAPYGNGTSALIHMPVISPPKRSDSTIERVEMPTPPTKHNQRSRSPSPTSADIYHRQTDREHHTDISDNFSRLTLNDKEVNKITTENPLIKPTYSYSSSREEKRVSSHTDSHSRDSSPSTTANSNRSPSPTSGYASSGAHGDGTARDSSSPPSAFVPQHDYLNTRSSNASVVDRQSPTSPKERTSSALHDFVSKTNTISSPSASGKYSTLAALIKPHRPLSQLNSNGSEYDN
ncbi:unnamed protein product [Adineta ricciae]|uniref:LIM zinc-binding domain-containing protein n=1 Tax=Adineta ricciae TaxID=249248 RepID=A0A813ZJE8_ADIRI|nr:unnamed protein product [Adineta ricciae]